MAIRNADLFHPRMPIQRFKLIHKTPGTAYSFLPFILSHRPEIQQSLILLYIKHHRSLDI